MLEWQAQFQKIQIFETPVFGKVLALDNAIQITERDNHIYHEMLAHVPMFAHGNVKDVLIVGGGDGGCLREVLKHPVDSATMVEIDSEVVELSRRFFPEVSGGAFLDDRARRSTFLDQAILALIGIAGPQIVLKTLLSLNTGLITAGAPRSVLKTLRPIAMLCVPRTSSAMNSWRNSLTSARYDRCVYRKPYPR